MPKTHFWCFNGLLWYFSLTNHFTEDCLQNCKQKHCLMFSIKYSNFVLFLFHCHQFNSLHSLTPLMPSLTLSVDALSDLVCWWHHWPCWWHHWPRWWCVCLSWLCWPAHFSTQIWRTENTMNSSKKMNSSKGISIALAIACWVWRNTLTHSTMSHI